MCRFCTEVASRCQELDIWWCIENPTGSYMWVTSAFKDLWKSHAQRIRFATFHNCVCGGDRKKSTTFWTTCDALSSLSCTCLQEFEHVHKEWGRQVDGSWATSQEAAYPTGLCSQYASLVLQAGQASGRVLSTAPGSRVSSSLHLSLHQTGVERASQGLFPRGSQMPPLVDPFTNKVWYQVPQHVDRSKFVPGKRITEGPFVKGSTTLSVSEHEGKWWAHVGMPVQPEEFLNLSGASVHPECHKPVLPVLLEHAVDRYCSLNNTQRNELRVHVLKGMIQRAQELADQEREVHAGLEPHARDVLKGKRLLLFQDLLSCMNFPDVNLVQDMQQGFRLTGWLEDTSVRPTKVVVPILSADDLWQTRADNNSNMWHMCRPSGDDSMDQALWHQTLKECQSGWCTLHAGLTHPPKDALLSRRFAVQQQDKVRPIDDFSVSQVNNTLGSIEKIVVMPRLCRDDGPST